MYGIDQCEKGAPRNERSGHDFSSVTEIITKVNENISPLSIRAWQVPRTVQASPT